MSKADLKSQSFDLRTVQCDSWYRTRVETTCFRFVWVVENFSQYHCEAGQFVTSFFNAKHGTEVSRWQLALYPHGQDKDAKSEDRFLSVFLHLVSSPNSVSASYVFSLLNNNGTEEEINNVQIYKYDVGGSGRGRKKFVKRNALLENAKTLLPNDSLTICCNLTVVNGMSTSSGDGNYRPKTDVPDHLSEDLNSLREKMTFSDVTFVVGNRKFQAHKNILAARSSVFEAMLQSDMMEERDVIYLDDIGAEIFEEVLRYMYNGKAPVMQSVETAEEILYAAHKYFLLDLRRMCEVSLSEMVEKDNAIKLLITADKFSSKYLNDVVTEFAVEHISDLMGTDEWQELEKMYYSIARDVIRYADVKKSRKV